ncbi:hypothetical protein DFH11DRAFT_1549603 [Phellopilus nigrolimitatus]|nr:hypothetical protein DFH11DRAFT_1549603 [Phellopilus nigrolimitatus]
MRRRRLRAAAAQVRHAPTPSRTAFLGGRRARQMEEESGNEGGSRGLRALLAGVSAWAAARLTRSARPRAGPAMREVGRAARMDVYGPGEHLPPITGLSASPLHVSFPSPAGAAPRDPFADPAPASEADPFWDAADVLPPALFAGRGARGAAGGKRSVESEGYGGGLLGTQPADPFADPGPSPVRPAASRTASPARGGTPNVPAAGAAPPYYSGLAQLGGVDIFDLPDLPDLPAGQERAHALWAARRDSYVRGSEISLDSGLSWGQGAGGGDLRAGVLRADSPAGTSAYSDSTSVGEIRYQGLGSAM